MTVELDDLLPCSIDAPTEEDPSFYISAILQYLLQEPGNFPHVYTPENYNPAYCIGGINGMNTSKEKAFSHAAYIHRFAPDIKLEWTHNISHGQALDLVEIFLMNYYGVSLFDAGRMMKNWTAFHERNMDYPEAKYLHFCHSQGAIHTLNAIKTAPEEVRNRLIIIAIAPAAIIPRSLCHDAYNYSSRNDLVHFGEVVSAFSSDPILTALYLNQLKEKREELILLEPKGENFDHSFQSPTYQEVIKRHIEAYLSLSF